MRAELLTRSEFDHVYKLALRRCGSRSQRFCCVGAAGDPYMDERAARRVALRETDVSVDTVVHDGTGHTSVAGAATLAKDSLDFIFLSERVCSDDLIIWWSKLRPGGLMAGAGYGNDACTTGALDAFVAELALKSAFRASGAAWLVYKSIVVDATYCINLRSRPDRRASALARFRATGIDENRVTFVDGLDGRLLDHPGDISDGQAGCAASHLFVMHQAARCGARHVLIFEDDVQLVPDFASRLESALARCPATYDLFHVGALCRPDWGNFLYPFDDVLARAGSVFGTHAYVVNLARLPFIDAALATRRRVIDQFFVQDVHPQSNSYVCAPYLAFQIPGISDVAGGYNDNASGCSEYVWR
jgi:hypothetical protein